MTVNSKRTAIKNVRIFDGHHVIDATNIIVEGSTIAQVGGEVSACDEVIDATGLMLLPGLMDAHVHTSEESLREALKFGVTTELEMMGSFTSKGRAQQLKGKTDIADVRSAGMALTAPGGHPDELIPKGDGIPESVLRKLEKMSEEERAAYMAAHKEQHDDGAALDVTTAEGAIKFVQKQMDNGADYFKVMIEEGTVMNSPGLPMVSETVMKVAVEEAHRHGKLAIAHVLTAEAAMTAMNIGVDGLAHLFIDRPSWVSDLIKTIAQKKAFVTPCLVLNSSIIGYDACELAQDRRVVHKLDEDWKNTMCSCFHTFPEGNLEDNFKNVYDLHKAGVDILVGTDVSVPMPHLGGLAHGVSVHHEMQLLVKAGLTPIEALRAATSTIARVFSLHDRGVIAVGARADLLLVEGDPTINISDSLSIHSVWINGVRANTF